MIKDPLVVSAYWLSLALIGYSVLLFVAQKTNDLGRNAQKVLRQFPLIIILVSTAVAAALWALIALPLFLWKLPVGVAVVVYLAMLVIALTYVTFRTATRLKIVQLPKALRLVREEGSATYLGYVSLFGLIMIDLFIAYVAKANSGGDTIYHMSRVVNILAEGFNTQSSLISTVSEGSYHVNVIYVLYAVPAQLFGMEPLRIWAESLVFFRLLQWAAVFTFARYVVSRWLQSTQYPMLLTAAITIAGYLSISERLFISNYPNQLVIFWILLMIISAAEFWQRPKMLGLITLPLALLITLTHPIYALGSILYLLFFMVTMQIRQIRKAAFTWRSLAVFAAAIGVLALGPGLTFFAPSMHSTADFTIGDSSVINFLGLQIASPRHAFADSTAGNVIVVATIAAAIYLLAALRRNKVAFSVVASLLSVHYAVLFLPPLFMVFHKALPIWVLKRFEVIDIVTYVSLGVIIWALIEALAGLQPVLRREKWRLLSAVMLLAAASVFLLVQHYPRVYRYKLQNEAAYAQNLKTAQELKSLVNNNAVVIIEPAYGYMLASVLDLDLISVERGHFPVAADEVSRSQCLNKILGVFGAGDIKAVGAKYVMVPKAELYSPYYQNTAASDALQLRADSSYYLVYQVRDAAESRQPVTTRACSEFSQKEQSLAR